jgi:predicted dehydrogenase
MKGIFLGAGFFAPTQLSAWATVAHTSIAAIYGQDEANARTVAAQYSIPHHGSDLQRLISQVRPDFADICTSRDRHFECARICADAGLPILCQKPIAPALQESRECVAYCEQAGVRLMINDNWRWQPWYRELKRLLDAGIFGKPLSVYQTLRTGDGYGPEPYAEQPYFRLMPRFLVLETAIHYLDTYRFLFGEPERLSCTTRRNNPVIAGEDQAVITLHYHDGPSIIWDGNRTIPTAHRRPPFNGTLRLEGTEASLDMDEFGAMRIRTPDGRTREHHYAIPAGYRGGSVAASLAHFADCLRTGAPFETSGADYLKTTELTFLAYDAAESGQTLTVAHAIAP